MGGGGKGKGMGEDSGRKVPECEGGVVFFCVFLCVFLCFFVCFCVFFWWLMNFAKNNYFFFGFVWGFGINGGIFVCLRRGVLGGLVFVVKFLFVVKEKILAS